MLDANTFRKDVQPDKIGKNLSGKDNPVSILPHMLILTVLFGESTNILNERATASRMASFSLTSLGDGDAQEANAIISAWSLPIEFSKSPEHGTVVFLKGDIVLTFLRQCHNDGR